MGGKGSGGHNRKPAAVRKLQGNAGKRKINEDEPTAPPADAESAPQTLSPLERAFWNEIFPIVSGMRIMTSADVFALAQLCRFLAEERECTDQLKKTGRLIPKYNEAGQVIGASLNPLARLRSDAARHVRAYLAVFGLGPSFRSALRTNFNADDDQPDALDDLFDAPAQQARKPN